MGQNRPQAVNLSFGSTDASQFGSAREMYENALRQYQAAKYDAAIALLQRAVQINPGFVEAHNSLCVLYARQNRIDEAIEAGKQAIALRPDYAPAFYNLGMIFEAINRLDEALAAFKSAVLIEPANSKFQYDLGGTYLRLDLYAEAADAVKRKRLGSAHNADAENEN
jgi:tetratricopeptide (TPR) repeat protein